MSGAGFGEDVIQSEVGDALEMAKIARNQLEVVVDGRGCDLQVGVGEDVAALLQSGANHPEDASGRKIVGEDRNGRKDTFFDVV